MRFENCAIIVLAGGLSKRFGTQNKLLAELKGRPLLSHSLEVLAPLKFGAHYCVSPGGAEITGLIAAANFTHILNSNPQQGQGRSLSLGAQQALKDGYDTLFIALADMPFITASHIQNLRRALTGHDIAMSGHGETLLPPAVFRGEAAAALARLSGNQGGNQGRNHREDQGAKSILPAFNVTRVPLPAAQALDIDTLQDLEAAQKAL